MELLVRHTKLLAMLQPDAAPASSASEVVGVVPDAPAKTEASLLSTTIQYCVFAVRSMPWPDAVKVKT